MNGLHCSAADRAFLADFVAGAVAPAMFHHREHLVLAYVLLLDHDVDAACSAMRSALLAFLRHHRIDPAKYHETLTRGWLLAVAHFMAKTPSAASAEEFLARNPRLLDPAILHTHWSPAALAAPAARTSFVTPDVEPIPS
ncbi:MAG: hypothetical protein IPK26_17105 [Planctomycetes bacterium]|nr:hypothetical protein [Planctomycetota bacterium]